MISREENIAEGINDGRQDERKQTGSHLPQKKALFTLSSNIIFTNGCRVNETMYFGQLPPLDLPEAMEDTGGVVFDGEIEYGKGMAPMWIVTTYRLAIN
jgi:hypothetical protein